MSEHEGDLQAQLNALREGFIGRLPLRLATLEQQFQAWRYGEDQVLEEFHRAVHSLTGAGATYGCDEVSRSARELERYLKAAKERGGGPVAADLTQIDQLLNDVRLTIEKAVEDQAAQK